MSHLYSRLSRRTWIVIAAVFVLAACGVGLVRVREARSQLVQRQAATALTSIVAPCEYTIHDGTVLEGDGKASDKEAPGDVGKVESLDLGKAYERAKSLAALESGQGLQDDNHAALVPE